MDAIVARGLSKSYGEVEAVGGVDMTVRSGELFALLGPNGAGKTTTLEILEGFRKRTAGSVEVLGLDPATAGRRLRNRVGIVLQRTAIDPYLTVRESLTRTAGYYPRPRPVGEVIELVGLGPQADSRIKLLSGGQQRRLDLGLGIVGNPDLLFLDEPTTGFDPSARREAWDLVRRLTGGGTTVVLTTHYMDEAQALADRVAVITGGRIVSVGTPDTLAGRDRAQVRVRFRLPVGTSAADLPVPAVPGPTGLMELNTADELAVLHRLTGWALERDVRLAGLSVDRPSLEDVYLELTAEHHTLEGAAA